MAPRPHAKPQRELDADRDNPFAGSTRSLSRGLAKNGMDFEALIAYATSPGAPAFDGDGRNSALHRSIDQDIRTAGLDISLVMRNVRRDVVTVTSGKQVPWYHSSLSEDVILVPEVKRAITRGPREQMRIRLLQEDPEARRTANRRHSM
jgi:hypothetical protein